MNIERASTPGVYVWMAGMCVCWCDGRCPAMTYEALAELTEWQRGEGDRPFLRARKCTRPGSYLVSWNRSLYFSPDQRLCNECVSIRRMQEPWRSAIYAIRTVD